MIKPIIFIMAYLIIGCLFAIAFITVAGEDRDDGTMLAFVVLSFLIWPIVVVFFIVAVVLELLRRLKDD